MSYIGSKKADNLFIIGTPLIALLTIAVVCEPRMKTGEFLFNPKTPQWLIVFSMIITQSHVMLVFLRSHMNSNVLKRFPYRFGLIPVLLLASMWLSPVVFGFMAFIALYWDEWHSIMQIFGFGRIYDAKIGNDPNVGRKLDMGMCFVLGLLPHVILITCIPEEVRTEGLHTYLELDVDVAEKYGGYISAARNPLIAFGVGYFVFYILYYRNLAKLGYKFSKAKLSLFATTGISTLIIASFYAVADAAYFGNIYHAFQYYFIVYMSEGSLLPKKFGQKKEINKTTVAICFFIVLWITVLVAVLRTKTESIGFLAAFWLMTSLLHFWYDGFIWSVRKQDI